MSDLAKILSLSYSDAIATKTSALKTYYRSVRFIKDGGTVNPGSDSKYTNVLLNGKCIDPETRCLYVFYIDTFYNSAWIIEFNLDSRVQTVVYYDKYNVIGFDPLYKIYNAKVVHGKLVWTDNKNPIYQMDIERAKKSFYYKIGYGYYTDIAEWVSTTSYDDAQIVSCGNYFYKSNITGNVGASPKIDDGTLWTKLCLIEDAYYSQNVENFYFEAMPPKLPPQVEYFSDDKRRINSLKQTLFQFAYRYVYMDWRKSTFSPASIVAVPQAEEETATGLANEQVSLNNGLKITVNMGSEEVRAVDIVARSDSDISKWYLIETINKFDEEERAGEVSVVKDTQKATITITIPAPIVTSIGIALPDGEVTLALTILIHGVVNTYILASDSYMVWGAEDSGLGVQIPTVISVFAGLLAEIQYIPTWIKVIETAGGTELIVGSMIANGTEIALYPSGDNVGAEKTDELILKDAMNNECHITTIHEESLSLPEVVVSVHPDDPNGLTISSETCSAISGSLAIQVGFQPYHPFYGPSVGITINYYIYKNSILVGDGSFVVANMEYGTRTLVMDSVATPGDYIEVLIWEGELI